MALRIEKIIANYLKYKENISTFSPMTIKAYQTDLNQIFNDKLKAEYSYEELWPLVRASLSKWGSLSLASRNRKIATLKSFFGWLYEQKLIESNYSEQISCPKVPKKIPHFLSVDEVLSVLSYLSQDTKVLKSEKEAFTLLKQKTLFYLLYGAGMRISEACNVKWNSIKFSEQKILVTGKGNKERYSVLPHFCIKFLMDLKNLNPADLYIFGSAPLNPRAGYELIRQLGAAAGLVNSLHPHALRHSYATHLLANGTNLRTLQSLLGHTSLQATEKYTHLSVDHLARLVERTHPLTKLKISS